MRTPASISKHPIHPMLIVFPIALWIFSLACDLIRLAGAPGGAWITVAFYSMVGGLIGALCAAVPGLIDLLYYKGGTRPVKKIALTHMTINLIVVALYAINIWLRSSTLGIKDASMSTPVLLSIIGVALLFVSGWLGGQMVHVYGVALRDGNNSVSAHHDRHIRYRAPDLKTVDMVQKADSGHPGLPLGAAPMAYVLWTRFLKYDPRNPDWVDRDRFVLSAGHGSALLYSLLYLSGYALSLDDIRQFRQWGSKTPGHPERGHTPGVEVTTGPLGQGMANAVGMAIAEAQLAARYNRLGHALIDHYTYALVSDGDLMEGVGAEAASLAGHLRLGRLICLYDDNYVTLSAGTDITFTEDRAARFRAYGWHTIQVEDGNDLVAIDSALTQAHAETRRPSLILIRTHIGYGSPEQDSYKAHGSPLGVDDVRRTKETLNWPTEPAFLVPDAALAHFREALDRGAKAEADWNDRLTAYTGAFPELAAELKSSLRGELPAGWNKDVPVFPTDAKGIATREASGKIMNAIAPKLSALTGGSADLDPSTKTALIGLGDFNPLVSAGEDTQGSEGGGWSYTGRNLHFGVREHAMGAIVNGMAAHGGTIPYGATFLIFSDYMRPPTRLAALSHLHVILVFTHDSIALGEDGPTHQPIEQLANLRAIPNLTLLRPGDANETAVAWQIAVEMTDRPVLLVLSRQAVPTLDRTLYAPAQGVRRGGYVLKDAVNGKPRLILIASGSEVGLIVAAADRLQQEGIAVRCVSMPSWDLFDALAQADRDAVLPPSVRTRLAVEAGATQGWHRYVGDAGHVIGVDLFGASAPGKTVLHEYGFTVDNVCLRAKALLS